MFTSTKSTLHLKKKVGTTFKNTRINCVQGILERFQGESERLSKGKKTKRLYYFTDDYNIINMISITVYIVSAVLVTSHAVPPEEKPAGE